MKAPNKFIVLFTFLFRLSLESSLIYNCSCIDLSQNKKFD